MVGRDRGKKRNIEADAIEEKYRTCVCWAARYIWVSQVYFRQLDILGGGYNFQDAF